MDILVHLAAVAEEGLAAAADEVVAAVNECWLVEMGGRVEVEFKSKSSSFGALSNLLKWFKLLIAVVGETSVKPNVSQSFLFFMCMSKVFIASLLNVLLWKCSIFCLSIFTLITV